ncbi:acyl-CoA dehydrogenase family protein [Actinokineospora guangxiensis]|uniref:Acyl-CoA dehydrogenase family protein n=1 Tax=Actinokineospora guangxiensis TaxID=1490288 RepID=A0ABW0EV55_9PSEU
MTVHDAEDMQADELMKRVRQAVPTLLEHAAQTELALRPTPQSRQAARAAGAFALMTPRRFGGLGADRATIVRVLAELGRGCPSTAWVAATSAEAQTLAAPLMPEELLKEFYADPDVRLCGVGEPLGAARQVPGGLRFSGRWGYASGCEDSPWTLLLVAVTDDGTLRRLAPVLVPTSALRIDRTWDVMGLRGTGSHSLAADDVFVPDSHVLDLPTGPDGLPDPSVRPEAHLSNACYVLSPMLGAAQGALDVVSAALHTRKPPLSEHDSLAASASARQLFAQAAHRVGGARDRVLRVAEHLDRYADTGALSELDRAALTMDIVTAARQCRTSVDELVDLHGSSGLAAGNPLQRFWRDLQVGTRHAQLNPYLAVEDYGLLLAASLKEGGQR